jgi:hypothetical protein
MKYLYVVDHFVPFPSSEYGGIWNVVASNNEECFDLITDFDADDNVGHYSDLRQNIMKARVFPLAQDIESSVIAEFTT